MNGCSVPWHTGAPAVLVWALESPLVQHSEELTKPLAPHTLGAVPTLSPLIRNLNLPRVLHKEFNISNLHALLLSAMCFSILITQSWLCGLPCKWRLSCFALWLGSWDVILEEMSPLPATQGFPDVLLLKIFSALSSTQ